MIRDKIRQVLYECMVTQDAKCEIEKAVLKTRQSLSINIKELRKDPSKLKELNNHELQLAFYLSCDELLKRPMSISKATLHEFVLMKLKAATVELSKSLKTNTRKDEIRKENELNNLINSDTNNTKPNRT